MKEKDYTRDIAEIRTMMERSSKFTSLSGISGVLAGIYALAGAFIAYQIFGFNPGNNFSNVEKGDLKKVVFLGAVVLMLAIGTAVLFSYRKANKRGEKIWNATGRRVATNMAVPLISGGILILIFISQGLTEYIIPFTLLFYGIALYNAGKFTYDEIKSLGIIQVILGLIAAFHMEYSLVLWALGFGIFHIIYGIYIHYRYER